MGASLLRILLLLTTCLFAAGHDKLRMVAINDLQGYEVDSSLTRMLTDRLRSEVIKTGFFQVLERGQVNQILAEQSFQQTGCVAEACVVQMGQLLGADYIVAGSVGKAQGVWSFSVKLVNVETGAIENSVDDAMSGDLPVVLNGLVPNLAVKLVKTVAGESKAVLASVGTGEVFVKTVPEGAQVWLDDELQPSVTPTTLKKIAKGQHVLRVRKDSLGTQVDIEVKPNDLVRLEPQMGTLTGDVRVSSEPLDAEVWIGDSLWHERTPTILRGLTAGNHALKIKKAGFVDWNGNVTAEYQQQTMLDAPLEQGFVLALALNRKPVHWSIDGADLGVLARDTDWSLSPKMSHKVCIKAPTLNGLEFYELQASVTGKAGERVSLAYEDKLDSFYVAAKYRQRVSIIRWTLLGLATIAGGVAIEFNREHAHAYNTYSALPQSSSQASFDHEWSQVNAKRNKFLATSIISAALLAGFGVTFAF